MWNILHHGSVMGGGQPQPIITCFEGHQNCSCHHLRGGLSKTLSHHSIVCQLGDSTEAGMHQTVLSVVESPLTLTHPISLERAGCVRWDGWSLEHGGHFQKIGFTLATRTN